MWQTGQARTSGKAVYHSVGGVKNNFIEQIATRLDNAVVSEVKKEDSVGLAPTSTASCHRKGKQTV